MNRRVGQSLTDGNVVGMEVPLKVTVAQLNAVHDQHLFPAQAVGEVPSRNLGDGLIGFATRQRFTNFDNRLIVREVGNGNHFVLAEGSRIGLAVFQADRVDFDACNFSGRDVEESAALATAAAAESAATESATTKTTTTLASAKAAAGSLTATVLTTTKTAAAESATAKTAATSATTDSATLEHRGYASPCLGHFNGEWFVSVVGHDELGVSNILVLEFDIDFLFVHRGKKFDRVESFNRFRRFPDPIGQIFLFGLFRFGFAIGVVGLHQTHHQATGQKRGKKLNV